MIPLPICDHDECPKGQCLREIEREGERAADQGYRRNQNPHEKGTQAHEWWDAGWSKSYDELCGT